MKMNKIRTFAFAATLGFTAYCTSACAQDVTLPTPTKNETAGSLTKALNDRHSTRQFTDRQLTDQTLSDLLWAADGVNRPDGKRTAPSAMNRQDVTIYVGKDDGTFRYDAAANKLIKIGSSDLRIAAADRNKTERQPVHKTQYGKHRKGKSHYIAEEHGSESEVSKQI